MAVLAVGEGSYLYIAAMQNYILLVLTIPWNFLGALSRSLLASATLWIRLFLYAGAELCGTYFPIEEKA